MSAPLVDDDARRAIVEDLDTTLVVEAAAGTGKTRSLVARIVALVSTGKARLASIVAVTFTEKAAGEMKLRLRQEIEAARRAAGPHSKAGELLTTALAELEEARISTIHGFAADLLRERPVEAGVDPLFEVAADEASSAIYGEAFERFYQAALADPPEGIRRVLRRQTRTRDGRVGPREKLFKAGQALLDVRDFPAGFRRDPFDRAKALDEAIEALRLVGSYGPRALDPRDFLAQNLNEIDRYVAELDRRERVRGARDYDGLEHELGVLSKRSSFRWKGYGKLYGKSLDRTTVLNERNDAKDKLNATLLKCDADLASCLREELRPLVVDYEAQMARAGKLDFLDLLRRARDLVCGSADVQRELSQRFSRLLVDEFQDTDPLQAELLVSLARDPDTRQLVPGKLFVVGDPKQSIYRFRRADVAVYHRVKAEIVAAGGKVLNLSSSHRSAAAIQRLVNATYAPLMDGSPGQASYVPLSPTKVDAEGRTHIVALPSPQPYGDKDKIFSYAAYSGLPEAVAALVAELSTPSPTGERHGIPVPVPTREICLLFKRFSSFGEDVTAPYVEALARRGVRHVQVGGRAFHEREEVLALRQVLTAIEWPDDELSVYSSLKGPFFALTDDALLVARDDLGGRLDPLRAGAVADPRPITRPVVDALLVLAALHHGRNERPLADTIGRFLEAVRAHAGIAIWPGGEQALANLLRTIDLARRFDSAGATSFRAFVERLRDDAGDRSTTPASVVEEGTDGVRLMTAFAAKGLEFGVVVLCDPGAPGAHENPSRYVDVDAGLAALPLCQASPAELRDHAPAVTRDDLSENVRLAYVAATRAKDLLVVPIVGEPWDGEEKGWFAPLQRAVLPPAASRAHPESIPEGFGNDTVLDRHPDSRTYVSVLRPGFHKSVSQERVLVWDAKSLLPPDARAQPPGLTHEHILTADAQGKVVDEGVRQHVMWVTRRTALLATGSEPSRSVAAVTSRTHGDDVSRVERVVVPSRSAERPRGARFGILVHAVLAAAPPGADAAIVQRLAERSARMIGATGEEVTFAVQAVVDVLALPVLVAAFASSDLRREVEISLRDDDGTMLEGAIDLTFRDDDGWVVVDYKTDLVLPADKTYDAQVGAYVRAVAKATGQAARGMLVFV